MTEALYIVAIFWIAIGVFLILYTERAMELSKKILLIKKIRLLAILPIVFGVILSVGAFLNTKIFWLCFILGLLSLLKGVYFLVGPISQIKAIFEWWLTKASSVIIRLYALIILVIGIAIMSNL